MSRDALLNQEQRVVRQVCNLGPGTEGGEAYLDNKLEKMPPWTIRRGLNHRLIFL